MRASFVAWASAMVVACHVSGNLDNVPNTPAVEVTHVDPEGPQPSNRPECPANPPPSACAPNTSYHCEPGSNGCNVCSCDVSSSR